MPFSVPFARNPQFIGRETLLQDIEARKGVTILHGPDGVGKSQVAIEHAYRRKTLSTNGAIIWLSGHGFWRLAQSIKEAVRKFSISRPDIVDFSGFIHWLKKEFRAGWLLILDDLSFESFPENEKILLLDTLNTLGISSGDVLITSKTGREEEISPLSDRRLILVSNFSQKESLQFMDLKISNLALASNAKTSLSEMLDHHPSSLDHAVSYLLESESMARGTKILQQGINRKPNQSKSREMTVLSCHLLVLNVALAQLLEESRLALDILYLLSLLDIQGVPMTILTLCCDQTNDWEQCFRRAIRKLVAFSMIRRSHDKSTIFLDESTQIHIYEKMDAGLLTFWQGKTIEYLAEVFPDGDSIYWPQCETLLPHVLTALTYQSPDRDSKLFRAILLCKLAKYNKHLGKFDDSYVQYSGALGIYQEIYGKDALKTLEVEKFVAGILYSLGKLEESEKILIRILEYYERSLPRDHYLILSHYDSLNAILQDLGKYQKALEYGEKAVECYVQTYGPKNANTLIAKWNLATLYVRLCEYEGAHAIFERILAAYREIYDETHPYIHETISAIASVLIQLNKSEEGIKMHEKAVKLASQSLDSKHPTLITMQGNLASSLFKTGRLAEAEKIQRQILNSFLTHRAPSESKSLRPALSLGCTLEKMSRFEDAREVLEAASNRAKEAKLSPTNPLVLDLQNTLALVHLRLGDNVKAELQFIELVKKNQELYGEHGQDVLVAMNNLGGALQRQEKFAEAEKTQRDVLERCKTKLGERNRLTMRIGNNLAETLRLWGEKSEDGGAELLRKAEELHRGVLALRIEELGSEALDTWISKVNLGCVLQDLGKEKEAKEFFSVWEKLENVAGSNNETVQRAKKRMSMLKRQE